MDKSLFQKRRSEYLAFKNSCMEGGSIFDEVQDTHYIVPADNINLINKAVNFGCSKAADLLSRYEISTYDLAEHLKSAPEVIENIILEKYHADLILIDGEDATLATKESIKTSRKNAVDVCNFRNNYKSLIYYRPSGIELEYCIDDIIEVLTGINPGQNNKYPLDGIIYPKVESVTEIQIILDLISEIEKEKNLSPETIKIQFLIESSQGIEFIYEIAASCRKRLTGIIFGMADYASDIGVSSLDENHPMFQFAKQRIINVSSALNVPAIDCMSFRYPVADKTNPDVRYNKKIILDRMLDMHDLYLSSIQMGMTGKWVGHPLQLLAAKIAMEKVYSEEIVTAKLNSLMRYSESISGAMVMEGQMADRATDRSIRSFLRKAVIKDKLNADKALKSGLITPKEFETLYLRGRRDSNPRLPA